MSKCEVPTYKLSTIEDIENIPDYETARKYIKKWKISTKGVKSKDEAILKLTEFWRARELASVFEEKESRKRSEIQKIKDNVEGTKEALHEVLIQMRDRDEKLPLLMKKAQDVHQMSKQFKKTSFKARAKSYLCQKSAVFIILVFIAVVVTTALIILKNAVN